MDEESEEQRERRKPREKKRARCVSRTKQCRKWPWSLQLNMDIAGTQAPNFFKLFSSVINGTGKFFIKLDSGYFMLKPRNRCCRLLP